tara:strand:- start:185 stop:391 length:207 start_codon:yes stop_codon:yes gene_type:complete
MSQNKCSLKVVKNGKRLHGTAAILHMTSQSGGFDAWLKDYSEEIAKDAAETAIRNLLSAQQKPKLKVM